MKGAHPQVVQCRQWHSFTAVGVVAASVVAARAVVGTVAMTLAAIAIVGIATGMIAA